MTLNLDIQPNLTIKRLTDNNYRVIFEKVKRNKDKTISTRRDINEIKLDNNVSRAKQKIYEMAVCNDWEYFVTLTLNKQKMDRYDLSGFIKKLGQWIRNKRRSGTDLKYMLIPEPHKDNAWHMHGLMNGFNEEELIKFTLEDDIPLKIKNMIIQGRTLYWHKDYREKFGWIVIEPVKNKEAISKYITKYVSKALQAELKREKEKKLYYASRGLKISEKIIEGALPVGELDRQTFDFENDYVKIKTMDEFQISKFTQQYYSYLHFTTEV